MMMEMPQRSRKKYVMVKCVWFSKAPFPKSRWKHKVMKTQLTSRKPRYFRNQAVQCR